MKYLLTGLLTLCLLSACGWQLRGTQSGTSVIDTIYLQGRDTHGFLLTDLRQQLTTERTQVVDEISDATVSLTIVDERQDRRTAAVGADALTSAYEMTLTVDYLVADQQGQTLAPESSASIIRTYNYNANDATASAREEALLLREMRRDLAAQIIRRINALYSAQLKTQQASKEEPVSGTPTP